MSFQGSINQALGTASEVVSNLAPEKKAMVEAKAGIKSKTSDFKNFDKKSGKKAADTLKKEIEGKKEQTSRVQERINKVRKPKPKPDFTKPIQEGMSFD